MQDSRIPKIKFPKNVYLIRHAQTDGNVSGNWLGSRSVNKINEYGRKQAKDNVRYLKEQHINASKIYASPTERALGHAEILQKHLNLPIEKINSLTEINLGILEDRSRAEGLELTPEMIHNWKTDLEKFAPALGESALEASERFYETLELIGKNYADKDIIIISHGVVIKLFLARILNASIKTGELHIKVPETTHGSITEVKFDGKNFKFLKITENKFPDSKEVADFG